MKIILSTASSATLLLGGSPGIIAANQVPGYLYIQGDDVPAWHKFGVNANGVWSDLDQLTAPPSGSIEVGNLDVGSIVIYGADGLYHTFATLGGAWSDIAQSSTRPTSIISATTTAKATTAFYQSALDDFLFRKYTVVGGAFSNTAQGTTIPL